MDGWMNELNKKVKTETAASDTMTETMTLLFWLTYEHMNQGAI